MMYSRHVNQQFSLTTILFYAGCSFIIGYLLNICYFKINAVQLSVYAVKLQLLNMIYTNLFLNLGSDNSRPSNELRLKTDWRVGLDF